MDTLPIESVIRVFHIYKRETLSCEREPFNIHDLYAIAIKDLESVMGHVPRFTVHLQLSQCFYEEALHVKLLVCKNIPTRWPQSILLIYFQFL